MHQCKQNTYPTSHIARTKQCILSPNSFLVVAEFRQSHKYQPERAVLIANSLRRSTVNGRCLNSHAEYTKQTPYEIDLPIQLLEFQHLHLPPGLHLICFFFFPLMQVKILPIIVNLLATHTNNLTFCLSVYTSSNLITYIVHHLFSIFPNFHFFNHYNYLNYKGLSPKCYYIYHNKVHSVSHNLYHT